MEKRILGRTGLELSVIGLGGIPIQHCSEEEAIELLKLCHEEGINFIDTARGYNDSEERIGQGLKAVGRDKFILATKSMARTYDGVLEEIMVSLDKLGTDYIDLFQFHNLSKEEDVELLFSDMGALKAVKELKGKNIIRHIGVTSHNAEVLDKLVDTDEFESIQFPYNFVEDQGVKIFEKAKAKDIGVLVMKPLAGGAIPEAELCLRFVLENENVSSVIPGMDSAEQIKENTSVGNNPRPLTDEERAKLKDTTEKLGHNFCRRCGYCMPCTVGIDIPSNFLMEGYYSRYDLKDWAVSRYEAFENKARDCIECGVCEKRCPYELPIRDMLKDVARVFEGE